MNSKKANKIVKSIFNLLEQNNEILDYLGKISVKYEEFDILPNNILSLPIDQNAAARVRDLQTKINNLNSQTLEIIRSIPPFKFIPLSNNLIQELKNLNQLSENETLNELLTNEMNIIQEEHTHAYSEKNFKTVYKFSSLCSSINKKLYLLKYLASTLVTLGESNEYDTEKYNVLEIYIDQNEHSVAGLGIILLSLHKLYNQLLKITHEEDHNLEYFKIETGTKWLKILGKKEAMILLTILITNSKDIIIEVIKNPIPTEKTAERISNSSAILELLEKSKQAGLPESELEIIRKAYIASILQISAGTKEIKIGEDLLIKENPSESNAKLLNKEALKTYEIE